VIGSATLARSSDTATPGVVLLHGIARTSRSLRKLEKALQQEGFATLNLDYASRKKPIEALAADIHPHIANFEKDVGGSLHFVAHSMGGLLARRYIASHRPARLARVVVLGTPNGGSELADILKRLLLYRAFYGPAGQQLSTDRAPALAPSPDYPMGIIAGCRTLDPVASTFILPRPNDGRVSVERSKVEGMTDHVIVRTSHTGLPSHPAAIGQTVAFLRSGRFNRVDAQGLHSLTP
jgi:pimeloyl-ACP methyl ester carboxylesterase